MTFSRRLSDIEKYLNADEFEEPALAVGGGSTIIQYDPTQEGEPELPDGHYGTVIIFEAPSNGRDRPEAVIDRRRG